MGTTVQQRHPVAPRPWGLGVLRRLAVATGLAHRSPPPRRLASPGGVGAPPSASPCWLGLRRSTTWANGGQHVGGERSGTPGERVPPSLRSAWGLSAWRCGPPRAPGGGAWSPSKRWRSLRFRPPGAIRRRRPWRSRGPRPPPRRPAERRARPLGSAQTVGTLAPRSCCVAAGVGREGYPCAWAAGRATAVRVSPPPVALEAGLAWGGAGGRGLGAARKASRRRTLGGWLEHGSGGHRRRAPVRCPAGTRSRGTAPSWGAPLRGAPGTAQARGPTPWAWTKGHPAGGGRGPRGTRSARSAPLGGGAGAPTGAAATAGLSRRAGPGRDHAGRSRGMAETRRVRRARRGRPAQTAPPR